LLKDLGFMKLLTVWIVLALTSFFPCMAQFRNLKVFETTASLDAAEPSIAIHPRNPLLVVAAVSPDIILNSADGGKTWQSQRIRSPFGALGNPVVVCDSKGVFYLIHSSDPSQNGAEDEKSFEALVCQLSEDGGKTWTEGITFGYNPPKDQVSPSASIDSKGNIWVTWVEYDKYASPDSACHSSVMMSSSSNGKKWSKPVELSQIKGSCAGKSVSPAAMAISDDKKVYAAWGSHDVIFLDRSFDGGSFWLVNDIVVSRQQGGWNLKVGEKENGNGIPTLAIDKTKSERKGLVFLAWADQRNGESDTDILFTRSTNFGDIWTPPARVNEGGTDKKHQYMPAMAVDNVTGYIYILYLDRSKSDDDRTEVYLAYSRNSGNTFKNICISESSFNPGSTSGRSVNIACHNGVIIPMWSRTDNGTQSILSAPVREEELPK
jgi:hypothetical protein